MDGHHELLRLILQALVLTYPHPHTSVYKAYLVQDSFAAFCCITHLPNGRCTDIWVVCSCSASDVSMQLLDLPQELLDLVATQFDAFTFSALRKTSKHAYNAFGGDQALKQALCELEAYWVRESHVMAVLLKEPHTQPERFPSYAKYLKRAPCYICLRIPSSSSTSLHTHHGRYQNIPMLPWDGLGGFDAIQLNTLNLQRRCIDCAIRTCRETGCQQTTHINMLGESCLFCVGCQQKVRMMHQGAARQRQSGLCDECFKSANPEWCDFKLRLSVRLKRIQNYHSWLRGCLARELKRHSTQGNSLCLLKGPVPPENDVREDWPLWKPVFGDKRPECLDAVQLVSKFANVARPMQSYYSWMQLVDSCTGVCPHKMTAPISEQLVQHGKWPQWPEVIQAMVMAFPDWGQAPCHESCQQRIKPTQAIVALRDPSQADAHTISRRVEAIQA